MDNRFIDFFFNQNLEAPERLNYIYKKKQINIKI